MSNRLAFRLSFLFVLFGATTIPAQGQGIFVSATGPVNRSMGGAGTAAPLESLGSLFWNPASISALPEDEVSIGMAGSLPVIRTNSSVPGLGGGSTQADPGVTPLLNVGWIHRPQDSDFTFGFGIFSAAGFRTNFPASLTNPVFVPQSNSVGVPGGLGQVYTQAAFMQLIPTVSWQMTDTVSVGIGPTITLGDVSIDPLVFNAPNDADGSGAPRYASGRGTRAHWGGGVQGGVYYEGDTGLHLGLTVKSPQWMETFHYNTVDELRRPQSQGVNLDLPMVISFGTAWSGFENFVFSTDIRYYDYANADGFGASGFRGDGSVSGLGWESIFAVATGVQYAVSEDLFLRAGYTFNENPIPQSQAFVNVGSPLYYQHEVHLGASYRLTKNLWLNLAYTYYLESDLSGPIVTPAGAIPGSNVTSSETVHIADIGITVRY